MTEQNESHPEDTGRKVETKSDSERLVSGLPEKDSDDHCPECSKIACAVRSNPNGTQIGRCSNGHRWMMKAASN